MEAHQNQRRLANIKMQSCNHAPHRLYALDLATRFDSGSPHGGLRNNVCRLPARFYTIIDENDRFFPDQAKLELAKIAPLFVNIYGRVSRDALNNMLRTWTSTPKLHLFQHVCETQAAKWGNPRSYETYGGEDLQNIVKHIAMACHPLRVSYIVLFKWLRAREFEAFQK